MPSCLAMSVDPSLLERLQEVLSEEPCERTWWQIVKVLDLVEFSDTEAFLAEGLPGGLAWPPGVERFLPLDWMQRLGAGMVVPEARLANAIDLGNGLSLKQPGGFDLFFQIEDDELDVLLASLPETIEILNYSDDVGDHPYHPGFVVDPGTAPVVLRSGPWKKVHTVRLNGFGIGASVAALVAALDEFPALRRLELDRGDDQGAIDPGALRKILQSGACQRLGELSLRGHGGMDEVCAGLLAGLRGVEVRVD